MDTWRVTYIRMITNELNRDFTKTYTTLQEMIDHLGCPHVGSKNFTFSARAPILSQTFVHAECGLPSKTVIRYTGLECYECGRFYLPNVLPDSMQLCNDCSKYYT